MKGSYLSYIAIIHKTIMLVSSGKDLKVQTERKNSIWVSWWHKDLQLDRIKAVTRDDAPVWKDRIWHLDTIEAVTRDHAPDSVDLGGVVLQGS